VIDADGALAYRGRIDDTYPELGRRRLQPTEHTLADAVTAVLEGRPVAAARTEAVGCLFETPPALATSDAALTYTRDVAPIVMANCVTCHRENEVGPFSLTSYQDAAKRAGQIARVVEQRLMPPWKAAQVHGEFDGQRTLTARQIEILKAWAGGSRAEGDPADLPAMPQFVSGWRLGTPDLIMEMQADFEVPADGPDVFQNFVIPIDIPEDKLVAVVDLSQATRASFIIRSCTSTPGKRAASSTKRRLSRAIPASAIQASCPPGRSAAGRRARLPNGCPMGWAAFSARARTW